MTQEHVLVSGHEQDPALLERLDARWLSLVAALLDEAGIAFLAHLCRGAQVKQTSLFAGPGGASVAVVAYPRLASLLDQPGWAWSRETTGALLTVLEALTMLWRTRQAGMTYVHIPLGPRSCQLTLVHQRLRDGMARCRAVKTRRVFARVLARLEVIPHDDGTARWEPCPVEHVLWVLEEELRQEAVPEEQRYRILDRVGERLRGGHAGHWQQDSTTASQPSPGINQRRQRTARGDPADSSDVGQNVVCLCCQMVLPEQDVNVHGGDEQSRDTFWFDQRTGSAVPSPNCGAEIGTPSRKHRHDSASMVPPGGLMGSSVPDQDLERVRRSPKNRHEIVQKAPPGGCTNSAVPDHADIAERSPKNRHQIAQKAPPGGPMRPSGSDQHADIAAQSPKNRHQTASTSPPDRVPTRASNSSVDSSSFSFGVNQEKKRALEFDAHARGAIPPTSAPPSPPDRHDGVLGGAAEEAQPAERTSQGRDELDREDTQVGGHDRSPIQTKLIQHKARELWTWLYPQPPEQLLDGETLLWSLFTRLSSHPELVRAAMVNTLMQRIFPDRHGVPREAARWFYRSYAGYLDGTRQPSAAIASWADTSLSYEQIEAAFLRHQAHDPTRRPLASDPDAPSSVPNTPSGSPLWEETGEGDVGCAVCGSVLNEQASSIPDASGSRAETTTGHEEMPPGHPSASGVEPACALPSGAGWSEVQAVWWWVEQVQHSRASEQVHLEVHTTSEGRWVIRVTPQDAGQSSWVWHRGREVRLFLEEARGGAWEQQMHAAPHQRAKEHHTSGGRR